VSDGEGGSGDEGSSAESGDEGEATGTPAAEGTLRALQGPPMAMLMAAVMTMTSPLKSLLKWMHQKLTREVVPLRAAVRFPLLG